MYKLELAENENILKKYDYVWWYGDGLGKGGELYITDKNLIFAYEKGILNITNHLVKTPLNKIKNGNGPYNVKYNDEEETVEIFYTGGQDEYSFDDENVSRKFINDLKEILSNFQNEVSEKNAQVKSRENNQNTCFKCGHNNVNNAKYCSNCGANLDLKQIEIESKNATKGIYVGK